MRIKTRPIFLVLLTILLVHLNVTQVFAGPTEYRQCADNNTCEIGEFLYDDDYTPINSATCTLNSKDPQGNTFLNDVSMTSESDGWYSYDVATTGEDYGLYRSQICCTYLTEYICLDKSFEIATGSATLSLTDSQIADAVWDASRSAHNTADTFGENLQNPSSLTADDIWAHPQRSLTTFGTLVSDIWSYSSRSINSFSSLVTSIWSNSDRTITSTTVGDSEIATKSDVKNIKSDLATKTQVEDLETSIATNAQTSADSLSEITKELRANRYFLELLVNAPIIETFIEEGEDLPDLQAKIKETKEIARLLSSDITILDQNILALNTNWEDTNYQIALNHVSSASRVLGASTESELQPDNINSKIVWLNEKWKNPLLSNLSIQTTSALSNIDGINREIRSYGKTFISQQYLNIAGEHIDKLEDIVGKESDSSNNDTLFGYIAYLEDLSDTLVDISLDLDEIIERWDTYTNSEKDIKLLRIKERFLAVNVVEGAEILLKKRVDDDKHRENLALALKGLINSNLIFLARDADAVSQNTWLEHGSIIFRSLVTNPSAVVSQNVQIKYHLPQEIGTEHIMKIEDGLETKFDTERNNLYVTGYIMLEPGETKTFIVEVKDVWIIYEEEIESIRKQTNTLFEALKGTSYFAQGATIKADIDVNLDKIAILKQSNQTPELKIKSHREAMLELNSARTKLEDLKTIVSSAGSIGTVFGFVGGVQAIAVWGLVIILIAGFVFLMIYLKMISRESNRVITESVVKNKDNVESKPLLKNLKKSTKTDKRSDISILALIKEIIVLKLNLGRKSKTKQKDVNSSKSSKKVVIILASLLLITVIALLIIVIGNTNQSNSELISPVPDSMTDNFSVEFLETKNVMGSDRDLTPPKQVADIQDTNSVATGLVLGKTTADGQEYNSSLEKGVLVQARIPSGYQAINVRTQPSQDAKLSGRLYISQKVYILEEDDGWVLIKTVNKSLDTPVSGWILENLTREIL